MLLSKLTSQRLVAHHRQILFRPGHIAAVIPHKKKSNKVWLSSSLPLSQIDPQSTESTLPSILALNESILTGMHHAGLPWWATIISSTLLLRSTFTLPIAIYQQRSLAKMIALAPMVQSWAETLKVQVGKDSRDRGWSYGTYQAELQKQYRKKVNAIYAQYGCSRYKLLLLPYVQIPLFVSMSLTLRHMTAYPLPWFGQTAQCPVQGLDQGGLEPFLDLTATDPTLILPVLVGAGNLLNVELNAWYAKGVQTPRQKIMTNLFRGLSIAFIPIAAHAPVAISLYWVTSAWYSVVQNLSFRIPGVRSKLGMPPLQARK